MPATKPRLAPLTGIRFFLALWVVVFHQTSPEGYLGDWMEWFPAAVFSWLRTGYVAVGAFFVLSGFVLEYSYPGSEAWSWRELTRFATARFSRIYPAYCLGLLLVAPFILSEPVGAAYQVAVAGLNWSLLQAWHPHTALTWNSPGWSLSNEAFFYACFPFLGMALGRLAGWRSALAAGGALWAVALLAPVTAVIVPVPGFGDAPATSLLPDARSIWTNVVKFNPVLHLPEFCVGVVACRIYRELSLDVRWRKRGPWLYGLGIWTRGAAFGRWGMVALSAGS